jgi:hypothetical protein
MSLILLMSMQFNILLITNAGTLENSEGISENSEEINNNAQASYHFMQDAKQLANSLSASDHASNLDIVGDRSAAPKLRDPVTDQPWELPPPSLWGSVSDNRVLSGTMQFKPGVELDLGAPGVNTRDELGSMPEREASRSSMSTSASVGNERRIATRSQHGISQPKNYTDGTIHFSLMSSLGEPATIQ